ncbi:MAG TPA: ribonuclease HIII [Bacilli bacterium]|nr:ribonuclease HIII [Bacilli bacterium]
MIIVYKISDNTKEKMIDYYKDLKRDKTPDYAIFQAEEGETIITLYNSNKVVFQGVSADVDANMWKDMEAHLNNGKLPEENKKKDKKEKEKDKTDYYFIDSVGSDEVGTGDYFGPIVVTAAYVNKKDIFMLEELKVKDSKKLTDDKILEIVPKFIDIIPHETIIYNNITYNNNYDINNMNKTKAILHNKVILKLLKNNDLVYDKVVVDQFVNPRIYFIYLKDEENVYKKLTFTTKAEDKCLSVACASLISRYVFLKEMDKLSKSINITLPKGAGEIVDKVGKEILDKYGEDKLKEVAKYHFKNTNKIKEL